MSKLCILCCAVGLLSLAGCATLINDPAQMVAFNTEPEGRPWRSML